MTAGCTQLPEASLPSPPHPNPASTTAATGLLEALGRPVRERALATPAYRRAVSPVPLTHEKAPAMSRASTPGEAYHWFTQDLRCMRRAHLTVRCQPGHFDDTPPTLDRFEPLVKKMLNIYGRETGDYIALIGVAALQPVDPDLDDREAPRWPHCHLLLQHWLRDPDDPVKDLKKLRGIGKLLGLNVKLRVHGPDEKDPDGNPVDMCDYAARHLRADDNARILAGKARTNFAPKNRREVTLLEELRRKTERKRAW